MVDIPEVLTACKETVKEMLWHMSHMDDPWKLMPNEINDHVKGKMLWFYSYNISRRDKCAETESKYEIPNDWGKEVVNNWKTHNFLGLLKFLIELMFVKYWEYN